MSRPRTIRLRSAAAGLLAVAAAPCLAQITADEVWTSWKEAAAAQGQALEASAEARAGGVLTLSDVRLSRGGEGAFDALLGEIALTEAGDGTVGIALAPRIPVTVAVPAGEEAGATGGTAELALTQDGLALTASGTPGAISYAYAARSVGLESVKVVENGEVQDLDFSASVADLEGRQDTGETIRATLAAGRVEVAISGTDPERSVDGQPSRAEMNYAVSDVTGTGESTVPLLGGTEIGALVAAGGSFAGEFGTGASEWRVSGVQEEGVFEMTGGAGSGTIRLRGAADGLELGSESRNLTLAFNAPDLALPPLSLAIDTAGSDLRMPLVAAAEAQPFALSLALRGVNVAEDVWTVFDPAGVLPRDPATLALAVSGALVLAHDLAGAGDLAPGTPPGEVEALALDELDVALAGARLTGTGAATFDNAETPPVPDGRIDLRLVGGSTLIDRLVQMGLIPQEQAMGARMMLSMFARAGEGEDVMESTIEFRPDGTIVANGTRIR